MSKNKIAARIDSQTVEVKTKVSGKRFLISLPYLKNYNNFLYYYKILEGLKAYLELVCLS